MIEALVRFTQVATWVFDPEDAHARALGLAGPRPRPLDRLEFELVARVVAGIEIPLPEPALLRTVPNPSGYYLFFGELRPDAGTDRRARGASTLALAPGTYRVRVVSQKYQVCTVDAVLPANPKVPVSFDLLPGFAYPFPTGRQPSGMPGPTLLRGALLAPDGTGRAGLVVTVRVGTVTAAYTTDSSGQWVVPVPDPVPDPGRPARDLPPTVSARVQITEGTTVLYDAARTIEYAKPNRLPVARAAGRVRAATGVPIAGARVEVSGLAGATRSRTDGRWSFAFPVGQPTAEGPRTFVATLPDGRTQAADAVVKPEAETPGPDFEF